MLRSSRLAALFIVSNGNDPAVTYQETVEWLFAQMPMYQRVGAVAYKHDLQATWDLMEYLGYPESTFKTIHVAGTNGKGSVSHALASVFQANGYTTGLYTSPHLKDFRERIRLNGSMIPEEEVADFVAKHKSWFGEYRCSFFEMTVGLAFDYFRKVQPDMVIIEAGMGGRLDSTNVIIPDLSIITNIGHDHQKFLGDTLNKIAGEKAGIIKQDIPVVIGEKHPETEPVFREKAEQMGAPITFAEELDLPVPESDLNGPYQPGNLKTVAAALEVYRSLENAYPLEDGRTATGLMQVRSTTGLRGRWEVISKAPKIILDGGHNEEAIRYLVKRLKTETRGTIHFILSFVNDKDLSKIIPLFPGERAKYYFTQANVPRAMECELLRDLFEGYQIRGLAIPDVREAKVISEGQAEEEDCIFVGGSLFTIADIC